MIAGVPMSLRRPKLISENVPVVDGAGVSLYRVFAHQEIDMLDPFLLLDDFHSRNPEDYMAGFPWHPHRGIETVTYMIRGEVEHGDSIGNKGVIKSGDVQWMTAGSGIIHQEMPKEYEGNMQGFQLWVNLPKKSKMMDPRYRGIEKRQIPEIGFGEAKVKVIAGELRGVKGPVKDLVVDVEYFDVELEEKAEWVHETKKGYTAFAYVFDGEAVFSGKEVGKGNLVLLEKGDEVRVGSRHGTRFLFASGKPLCEPVAWGGPIVMNTNEELELAFEEYEKGTFIKRKT